MSDTYPLIAAGMTWQQMGVGMRFRTNARTLSEADLAAFVAMTLYTEPLFLDARHAEEGGYSGRLLPGGMTFVVAEGLVLQTNVLGGTGLAFMHTDMDVKRPVYVGDTVHVEVEVTESRQSSKPGRGVVTSRNSIRNQRGEEVMVYNPVRLIRGDDFQASNGIVERVE
jgi:acyl dehydratase